MKCLMKIASTSTMQDQVVNRISLILAPCTVNMGKVCCWNGTVNGCAGRMCLSLKDQDQTITGRRVSTTASSRSNMFVRQAVLVHVPLSSAARGSEFTIVNYSTSRLNEPLQADACVRRTMPEREAAARRRTHRELPRVSFTVVELGPSDRDAG